MALDQRGGQEVALKDELEFLQKYLEIEQARFGDRLIVTFDIAPETLDAQVPNLLLQPLVENSVRHAVAVRIEPGLIEIRARQLGDDPGARRSATTARACRPSRLTSPGRRAWAWRIPARGSSGLYGANHQLLFGEPPGGGLMVTVTIPFKADELSRNRRLRRRHQRCRVTKIRTLVVDDEPMARERILGLLAQETDVEVIGQCADGVQAVSAIQQLSPELVFLDVQMPAVDGFGVIKQVGPDKMPMVVFVTAYDEYALQAFEVHALDYLLKPFGRDRLQQCLDHARHQRDRQRAGELGKSLLALVQDFKPEQKKQDRLVVKSGGRVFFVRTDDIDWIEASGNYVRLHLKEQSYLFRETMNQMESRLDPQRFFRIHRSRIVNTERIKELQPWFNGEYVVLLHNGTQLRLSRSYREKLEERLGKAL